MKKFWELCRKGDDNCQQPIANTPSMLLLHLRNLTGAYIGFGQYLAYKTEIPGDKPASIFEEMMTTVQKFVYLLQCVYDISVKGIRSEYYDLYCDDFLKTNLFLPTDVNGTSIDAYMSNKATSDAQIEKQEKYNAAITYFRAYKIQTFGDYTRLYTILKPEISESENTRPSPTKQDIAYALKALITFYVDYIKILQSARDKCNKYTQELVNNGLLAIRTPNATFIRDRLNSDLMKSLPDELNPHIDKLRSLVLGTCNAEHSYMKLIFEESDKYYTRFKFPGIHALVNIYKQDIFLSETYKHIKSYTNIKMFFIDNNITTFGDISKQEGGAYKRCKWIKHGKIVYKGRERVSYMWKTHTAIKLLVTANDGSRHFRYKKLNIASR